MTKILSICIIFLLSANLFGQIRSFEDIPKDVLKHLDKMGMDKSPIVNSPESDYFNMIFKDSRKDFDFEGKKVGFVTGSTGKRISNKHDYFDIEKKRFLHTYSPNGGILYLFDESQKEKSGGYDAVIAYWCKVLLRIKDLPDKLK
ncbi:hypothetical protein [Bacteroides ihuae]|uniref:hypothetical protein n=1 Tax=Bacteroides ihuae TaxID=1852362 RepID=UPI0008D9DE2A|nr:hypothetical protein [Bacteroides ihuae]